MAKARFVVVVGQNGFKYVDRHSVTGDEISISTFNSKTGAVMALNLPIEYSCTHACNCYKEKACYACKGCYTFTRNQALYSNNLQFFLVHGADAFVAAVNAKIRENKKLFLFRWFTCGDIFNYAFLLCMVRIAKENPNIRFWTYTKKYSLVNRYLDECGALPENLTVIFSHWLNDDGTYFPMENPHHMPTSEFIPLGQEHLAETVTHICPCSSPDVVATCATCEHPCYTLKAGESMALLEHSTKRTKTRDAMVKAAHDALKKA